MADQVEGERSEVAVHFRHLPAFKRAAQQEIDIGIAQCGASVVLIFIIDVPSGNRSILSDFPHDDIVRAMMEQAIAPKLLSDMMHENMIHVKKFLLVPMGSGLLVSLMSFAPARHQQMSIRIFPERT